MIGRLAMRSLTAHPVRSSVLAAGFGVGVGVMAILLGVAEVVLDQARAPALVGGGDVVIRPGPEVPARLLLAGTLRSEGLRPQIRVASPSLTQPLFLLHKGRAIRVSARAGIPSLERALGDTEVADVSNWVDAPADEEWTRQTPGRMLEYIDRFHTVPDAPRWSDSWAEWLYFNGRGPGGRFYLTFLVGPHTKDGRRAAGVRLQLDRSGTVESFTAGEEIAESDAMRAPNLTIGRNTVTLDGMSYRIHLDLVDPKGRRVRGDLVVTGSPGRIVPPIETTGALGWRTGYVVPVMSGSLNGSVTVDGSPVSLDGGSAYHDHNWGFWEGVSWQWGQVQQQDLSVLYGRVFPPAEAADPNRLPGFLGILGPDGPLAYSTDVRIRETNDATGRPQEITVEGKGRNLDMKMRIAVQSSVVTKANASGRLSSGLDFFQMRGTYTVSGHAAGRTLDFTAPGSAETFRGGSAQVQSAQ